MPTAQELVDAIPRKIAIARYHHAALVAHAAAGVAPGGVPPVGVQATFEAAVSAAHTAVEYARQALSLAMPQHGMSKEARRNAITNALGRVVGQQWIDNPLTDELRKLRNDIAHNTYEKRPTGTGWGVVLPGRADPIEVAYYAQIAIKHVDMLEQRLEALTRSVEASTDVL